jgi:serine-type D-Ala-D-Ala carboxypeptidase
MPLISAWEKQDTVFKAAFSVLDTATAERAFPAASIAVTHQGRLVALKAFGTPIYEINTEGPPSLSPGAPSLPGAPCLADFTRPGLARRGDVDFPVTPATLFDIASLTKVVATTTMAMILYDRAVLDLDAPVIGVIPEFSIDTSRNSDLRRHQVTLRMLLAHSSGLPAYEKLFQTARTKDELLRAAFTMPLSADPATRAEYSDIGFIVLGTALERIAQEPLDIFCQREIFGPLAMSHTTFNPPPEMRAKISPTADERQAETRQAEVRQANVRQADERQQKENTLRSSTRSTFRNRIIQGEVQDENAFVLGGVAPHAGLFSTAEDLARFAQAMLEGGSPIIRPEAVALYTRCESAPSGTTRALGWDTPSNPSQSGKYFGPGSYGHLGYTGTSLWIDPERQLSVTLLTNRTWPDCSNQAIKQVRPKFHDAVSEALDKIV